MNYYYMLAILALVASAREASARCKVKKADAVECLFEVVCYMEVRHDISLPNCTRGGRPRVILALKSSAAPRITCVPFLGDVLSLSASGNAWGRLPHGALRCMPSLQLLQLRANRIAAVPAASFTNFTDLRSLDLSANAIRDIHVATFAGTPNLQHLFLANNNITNIRDDTFAAQSTLQILDLSHNSLLRLHTNAFRGLDKLTTLRLGNNKIFSLNGALKHLNGLKHLYLRENKLLYVDVDEIPYFRQLKTLDFTNNTLSSIQPEVFSRKFVGVPEVSSRLQTVGGCVDCEPTVKILLSRNKIATLENATFRSFGADKSRPTRQNAVVTEVTEFTPAPTEIDLSFNMIDQIEFDAFQGIDKLTSLDISWNRLKIFYVNTTNLNHLLLLNLQNNYINTVDANTLYDLGKLTKIDISGNEIEALPKRSLWAPRDLKVINLSGNSIAKLDVSAFGELESLDVLDASRNLLVEVHIQNMHLHVLSLHSNNISDMSSVRLSFLLELNTLDLSRNLIATVTQSALAHLPALTELDLSSNNISEVEAGAFANMPRLATLDLSGNALTRVEYGAFSGLSKLEKLNLSGNRIGYLQSKALFDLKSLARLDLESNGLRAMDVEVWNGRRVKVQVSVGGNRLSCAWVASALGDAGQPWSGAWLAARSPPSERAPRTSAVGGIACDELGPAADTRPTVASGADDRQLYTSQKILNAILLQTDALKKAFKMMFSRQRARPAPAL